jgi:Ser-tRNA(Ala) deacylase AlaX
MKATTDLVWLREPSRRTLLATVTGTRGPAFVLDRSIFHATSHAYRHPQPADRGDVWIGGDKRILSRVSWERGELRHAVRGITPPAGTPVRCHLEAGRRDDASDAHAALHLVLSAFVRRRLGVLTAEPSVVGGRRFTVAARWTTWSRHELKGLLDAANAAAGAKHEIGYEYVPREAVRGIDVQPFADGGTVGVDPVLRIVRIGDASALPCDGTFPPRTAALGRIVAAHVQAGKSGVRTQFHVGRP